MKNSEVHTNNYQDCLKPGDDALKAVGTAGLIFIIGVALELFFFHIWTVIVAKNAKKETEEEQCTPVEILGPISSFFCKILTNFLPICALCM